MADDHFQNIGTLRHLIVRYYDRVNIGRLCLNVGIDYEQLAGESKLQKVNSLLARVAQDGRLAELVDDLNNQQPQITWPLLHTSKNNDGRPPNPKRGERELISALQGHLDDIKQRLHEADLHGKMAGDKSRLQARTLVRECLARLDPERRRKLIEFLYEKSYINRNAPILALNDADLRGMDLSWITLNNAFLQHITFDGSDFSLANLSGADLSGSSLRGVRLKAYLVGAELVKSDLREADLSGARLMHSSLAGANLRFANLTGADLIKANLTGVDLSFANLQGANFSGSNLSFATLNQVNLEEAIFDGAIIDQADFREADAP